MEPLGTITVYFEFIDEDTRKILESIMTETDNYFDFVNMLTQRVLNTDSSDLVVYFAIHHAAQLLDLKTIDLIGQKYSDIPILQPNICFARHFQGKTDDYQNIIKAADDVLSIHPDDWLALEMRFMKYEAESFNYPKVVCDTKNLDVIQKLIEGNPLFKFYNTVLYSNLARIANLDGDLEGWNRYNQLALENAREQDDQVRLAYCLIEQALISSGDRALARELLLESLEIMDRLGSTEGYASVLERLSTLEMIRGEFTSSIDNYLKVVSIREGLDQETGIMSLMLSSLYNSIGEYESGLDWGRMAEEQHKHRPSFVPRAVMSQVWSLVLFDRIAEAELILDTVHETVLKSGRDHNLAWLHFVIGLIEFAKGNPVAATSSLEESLKIFEAVDQTQRYQNMTLYYLARFEVLQADANTEVLPYLTLLEDRASSEDLPGILGQALMLKSELALIQNDDSSLLDAIQELRELTKEPRMTHLVPFVESLLDRI
ncbi:MAG: hypothetical protein RTV41_11015 [Candidatus Thorarchaeota archaeon]